MQYPRMISLAAQKAFSVLAIWIAAETMLFAKDASAPAAGGSEAGGGVWVWAYMVVILVFALAMIAVCKSSGRRDRAKPETYGNEPKLAEKE
jgi:hypothetical protein